jgi:predicted  nucleic acid-binding Zn-ribbon protein
MSYTNYPSAENPQAVPVPPKDNRKVIYGILIVLLLATWGWIIYDKSKSTQQIQSLQTQYTSVDSARNAIQAEYNESLAKEDSLTGSNSQLTGQLAQQKADLDKTKNELKNMLADKNAKISDLQALVTKYKGQVNDLFTQIATLKQENDTLTANNQVLTTQRDTLTSQNGQLSQNLTATQQAEAHIQDVGSTLHASNISITAIDVKGSGKQVSTSTAKRTDLLRVSFQLDENRIAPSGDKQLFICVTGPDGKLITIPSNGSGTFPSRDEGDKAYTSKEDVQYQQGAALPVNFDWKQDGHYLPGDYKIQIYQNGYKIGEGIKTLKKGGLFS